MAYNHESEVEFALNSILYQITEFGKGIECNLVITDDCSSDTTVEVIENWLKKHSAIFYKVTKRYNKINMGTVDNNAFMLSQIQDEPFKIIAADDMISANNIFKSFESMGKHTLFVGFRLFFNHSGVFLEEKHIRMQFLLSRKKYSNKKLLRLFRKGYIISTPQVLYFKQLFADSNAEKYLQHFRLFEDNPTWYSMIKNVDDLQITFSTQNVMLYRISEKSVSNSQTVNQQFQAELYQLYRDYIRDGNLYEKMYFQSAISGVPKYFKLPEYATRLFYFKCAVYAGLHSEAYRVFRELIMAELKKGEDHYKLLQQ